jgi:hypothetical protein
VPYAGAPDPNRPRNWQGQQDSNLRPAVLETAALPTELYPYTLRHQISGVYGPVQILIAVDASGAGEGNRTLVISLEGCCSTIELHPRPVDRIQTTGDRKKRSPRPVTAKRGGRGRTRTYEGVSQRIYSPPPLPLGTLSPQANRAQKSPRLMGDGANPCQRETAAFAASHVMHIESAGAGRDGARMKA